jgi:hypothetical protein
VTVAKGEQETLVYLVDRLQAWESEGNKVAAKHVRALQRLLDKLDAPPRVVEGISLSDAEGALMACRKYVPFVGGNPYPLVATMGRLKVRPEQLQAVGRWIDRQSWLRGGVVLSSILRNWASWLSQAVSESEERVAGAWIGVRSEGGMGSE